MSNDNKIFFDFEFIEGGSAFVMEPISLGLIRERDNATLYIEFEGVDWSKANDWVLKNVRPYLEATPLNPAMPKEEAKQQILKFCGEKPEFWAYFADYDWVLLCQLFERMIDLPEGWPMWCRDLKQFMWHFGYHKNSIPVENNAPHFALGDAEWNMEAYRWMKKDLFENEPGLNINV